MPILGVRLSPIQPQFKLNSDSGGGILLKNGPERAFKGTFCGLAKKNEPHLFGFPTIVLRIAQ